MSENQFFTGETGHSRRILYTPSPFARENLFYLQETGSLSADKVHIKERSYLDSFLFLMVVQGSGTVVTAGTSYALTAGDCMFIDCHHPYSHESSADLWTLRWAHFNGSTMRALYEKFLERSGSPRYTLMEKESYEDLLKRLFGTAGSQSYVRDMEIHELLSILLTKIMKDCWNENRMVTGGHPVRSLTPVLQYLQEHYREKITLDELAERFFINKYYLTRRFKEEYGITISDYILSLRIREAKEILRFSGDSLETIAERCGFYDLAYFSRKFKKAEGISPSAFRKQWM